jgi:Enoyl-(Acyl carrier protein) reductase
MQSGAADGIPRSRSTLCCSGIRVHQSLCVEIICSTFFRRLLIDAGEDPDALELDDLDALVVDLPVPWIEPSDVAEAVLFLVSDRARYVTGTQFVIDAGLLSRQGCRRRPRGRLRRAPRRCPPGA